MSKELLHSGRTIFGLKVKPQIMLSSTKLQILGDQYILHWHTKLYNCPALIIDCMLPTNSTLDLVLFLQALSQALQLAYTQDVEYRRGLPRAFLEYMGEAHADKADPRREAFEATFTSLWDGLAEFTPLDAAVDQLGVRFLEDSYPPVLSANELRATAAAGLTAGNGEASQDAEDGHDIGLETRVRAVRRNIARIGMNMYVL
jgi:hypothetical protein